MEARTKKTLDHLDLSILPPPPVTQEDYQTKVTKIASQRSVKAQYQHSQMANLLIAGASHHKSQYK